MVNDKIIACICEGSAESAIVNKLMDEGKLVFSRDDLLDNEVIRCRSAGKFQEKYLGKGFAKKITVYRILDSRREDFKLNKAYKSKIDIINIITAPEIEMLVIINEGKYLQYSKVKSKTKPSEFCKNTLKFSKVKSTEFITDYFSNVDDLTNAIFEYKRLSNIPSGEKCLADLLVKKEG